MMIVFPIVKDKDREMGGSLVSATVVFVLKLTSAYLFYMCMVNLVGMITSYLYLLALDLVITPERAHYFGD